MKTLKQGTHRLFQNDPETAATVSRILVDIEKDGMDAVRRYSEQFDEWSPTSSGFVAKF
jgi:sulfopropanediol 3-dehydrogenase